MIERSKSGKPDATTPSGMEAEGMLPDVAQLPGQVKRELRVARKGITLSHHTVTVLDLPETEAEVRGPDGTYLGKRSTKQRGHYLITELYGPSGERLGTDYTRLDDSYQVTEKHGPRGEYLRTEYVATLYPVPVPPS